MMKKLDLQKIIKEELIDILKEEDDLHRVDVFIIKDPSRRGEPKQVPAKNFDDAMKKAISIAKQVRSGNYKENGEVGFVYVAGNEKLGVTHFDEKYQDHLDVQQFGGERSDFKKFHVLGYKVGTTGPPKIVKW